MKNFIKRIKVYIQFNYFPSKHDKIFKKWIADGGDDKYRYDFPLTEDSLVIDLGGYKGQWASDIYSRYSCKIWIFEPVNLFAEKIEKRFSKNGNITVFRVGLGAEEKQEKININEDGSSIFTKGEANDAMNIVDAIKFFKERSVESVELMKINIEGGEYELLERLISGGFISKVKQVQVQFHDIVPDSFQRMTEIHKSLEKTHEVTFNYEFLWENWVLKNDNQIPV